MRKDKKETKTVQLETVQGYHAGGWNGNYAYQGFKSNKYFTSDRWIPLDENFRRADGQPLSGYGLEIETECRGLTNQTIYAEVLQNLIFSHFPDDLFKLQNDSSLGGDISAECITQVMKKSFIRNHYADFKLMYDTYFPAFRISCSQSGKCGMHVNISNAVFGRTEETQALAIRKLLYVVNHHYNMFAAMTNRSLNHTDYCGRMLAYSTKEGAKAADLYHMSGSHFNCFNGSHFPEGRIELRIVGGQSNFPCFRNTMECIFHVVEAVKKLSWEDLDDLTKVFSGCNQYVFDRLNTKCKAAGTITTEQLDTIRNTVIREELL